MASSSWDQGDRGGGDAALMPGWMKVALGLGLAAALAVAILVGLSKRREADGWPLLRGVAAQLATDDGAKELFEAQPGVRDGQDLQAFLEKVRGWRPRFGTLPAAPPPKGRSGGFLAHGSPRHLFAAAQGSGGGWLGVRLTQGPPGSGEAPRLQVSLGARLDDVLWRRSPAREDVSLDPVARYHAVALQLRTDEGVRALGLAHPDLVRQAGGEAAFLDQIRSWRPHLGVLPETARPGWPADLSVQVSEVGGGTRLELAAPVGAGRLRMVWQEQSLTELSFQR